MLATSPTLSMPMRAPYTHPTNRDLVRVAYRAGLRKWSDIAEATGLPGPTTRAFLSRIRMAEGI